MKIVTSAFYEVPQFQNFKQTESEWTKQFEPNDLNKEITRNDKILSFYKFSEKNNYKDNFKNSLGYFEYPETFAMVHSLLLTVAELKLKVKQPKRIEKSMA